MLMMIPVRRLPVVLLAAFAAGCAPARPAAAPAPAPAAAGTFAFWRSPVAAALDSVFNDTALAHAHWGVLVRSLDTGETLYARNAGRMFVPASNMKLVTAASALDALGPEYRYVTRFAARGEVRDGVLRGDLVVIGGGDPTISDRFHADVGAVLRGWADSLRAHGVRRVTGAIVADDDVFDEQPLGRGWAWDDVEAGYSAEISGLPLNEGVVAVRVAPGQPAERRVTTRPTASSWVPVESAVTIGPPGSAPALRVSRSGRLGGVRIDGTVPADTPFVETTIAVPDNTMLFAAALHDALTGAGIAVGGPPREADAAGSTADAGQTVLFTHTSPPLREILAAFLKPSQNQIGEVLLKTLGAELRGMGSAAAGTLAIDSMAAAWGLPRRLLSQADGSGLSRYNLVAPEFLAALLDRQARAPHFQVFAEALPVAGRDGTLASRMRDTPAEGNVRAKTGTLSGVRALSGYFTTAAGERMVFSMIVNHHTLAARDADRVAEAALMRLIALDRRTSGQE